jgi:flagellar hook-associated protein 2
MATSSVSGTSGGANFVMALGTGSGVDIMNLAQNLVNAEKQPKAELIQKSIEKSNAQISGYSVVAAAIGQIQSSLDKLADPALYSSYVTSSSLPAAVTVSGSVGAEPGTHQVVVSRLAASQRSVSDQLDRNLDLGSGSDVTVSINGTSVSVTSPATPEKIVKAINRADGLNVKASLVNMTAPDTGPVRVVLTGEPGASNSFTVAVTTVVNGSPVDVEHNGSAVIGAYDGSTTAQDAEVTIDGITVTRSSNSITGVLPGVTFNLLSTTPVTTVNGSSVYTPAVVGLTRETDSLKAAIQQLVSDYNDTQAIVDSATDPKSTVEKLGASLVGVSAIRSIRDQVRNILLPASTATSETSAALTDLRQLGLFVDTDGKMKFSSIDETGTDFSTAFKVNDTGTLDRQLATRFDDVRALFLEKDIVIGQYGPNNSDLHRLGIARAMADQLGGSKRGLDAFSSTPVSPLSLVASLRTNQESHITYDQKRLSDLEERMKGLLERYIKQFAVMDSLVGQSKSMQSGIENSFKGMSSSK